MKAYALFLMILSTAFVPSSARIINAYERDISSARASRQHLQRLDQDRNVAKRLATVEEFILYYELTAALLRRFRDVAPSLYLQIDTIVDKKGRPVDVYVKFVPSRKSIENTIASTNLNHVKNDADTYVSEYGQLTVSIRILAKKHSLLALAHELGHVHYQVSNLASYLNFFARNYPDHHTRATYLGHKPNDPSGQQASRFENYFRRIARDYYKNRNAKDDDAIYIRDQLAKLVLKTK